MSASLLINVARVFVAISTIAALVAHAWLTIGHPWIPFLSIAALAIGAIGGWTWRLGTQAIVLALGHVWPLLTFFALGRVEPLAVMIWISAVASLALATSPLVRWSVPVGWQIPVAAWGVLLACGWPIVLVRELDFTLITYLQNDTASGLWAGGPRDSVASVTGASAAALSSLAIVDWLWARYGAGSESRFFREVAAPMTAGTVIALGLGIYQGTVDLFWWSDGVWPHLGRAAGTLLDANALGSVLALWAAPMGGVAMLSERRPWRWLGLLLLALTAIGVWACGSRTAFLGLLFASAGIAVALWRAGRLSRLTSAVAVLAVVATVATGWILGGSGSALQRVWQTLPPASVAGVTQFASDMWVRDGYGAASTQMVREYPLTGVGPGAFQLFAPDYWFKLSGVAIPPDNAQNWWRHQWTEMGLVAGLVPIASSLLVLACTIAAVRRSAPPVQTIAAGAIVGTGMMSLVGSPVAHPIVLVTVAVLIFWTSQQGAQGAQGARGAQGAGGAHGATPEAPEAPGAPRAPQAPWAPRAPRAPRAPWLAVLALVWLLPIVWAGATAWVAVTELRPPYRAEEIGWVYGYGFSAPEALGGGAERRWAAHRAVGVIPVRGTRLVLTMQAPHDTAAGEPLRVRVSTRERVVLDQRLKPDEIATSTINFPQGKKWMMVQIETSGSGSSLHGTDRAIQITNRIE